MWSGQVALQERPDKWHLLLRCEWVPKLNYIFALLLTSSPSFNFPCSPPFTSYFDAISSPSYSPHSVSSSTHSYITSSELLNSCPSLSYAHAPPSSTTPHHSCDTLESESESPPQPYYSSSPSDGVPSAATYDSNSLSSYLDIPSSAPSVNSSIPLEHSDCKSTAFESTDCDSSSLISDCISSTRYHTTVTTAEAYPNTSFSCKAIQS